MANPIARQPGDLRHGLLQQATQLLYLLETYLPTASCGAEQLAAMSAEGTRAVWLAAVDHVSDVRYILQSYLPCNPFTFTFAFLCECRQAAQEAETKCVLNQLLRGVLRIWQYCRPMQHL